MLTVGQARGRILDGAERLEGELVALEDAQGRLLAAPLLAGLTQPPFRSSAMDGYAMRAQDLGAPQGLRVVGASAAGKPYEGALGAGDAVRIFTGAPVPDGADKVVPQEEALRQGDHVRFAATPPQDFIRPEGMDFTAGQQLLAAGTRLTPAALGLAAAGNHRLLTLVRRPRIAILATGDEIVPPGAARRKSQIHSSSLYAVSAACRDAGAEVINLGIAPDRPETLRERVAAAAAIPADLLLTLGGASVGEHDFVKQVFEEAGGALDFWRISMRPGKPLLFGKLGALRVVGLPGNPVSSFTCCWLFVLPLIRSLQGLDPLPLTRRARLAAPLPANDEREDYLRARFSRDTDGTILAEAFSRQDSSQQLVLAQADGFIRREIHAMAAEIGTECEILPFF